MLAPEILSSIEQVCGCTVVPGKPLSGGGNNQVYSIFIDKQSRILKRYFQSENDSRSRGLTEFQFCKLLWDNGERAIPEPICTEENGHWALYESVGGAIPDSIEYSMIMDAANFINRTKSCEPCNLPLASEAGVSNQYYSRVIENRVSRLRHSITDEGIGGLALDFVRQKVVPKLNSLVIPDDVPEPANQIVSASDFGFHNALCTPDRKIKFIDFEYAGMDDPCKLIADFFSQPKIPVDLSCLTSFLERAFAESELRSIAARLPFVFPLVRLKWCCILLNEFIIEERKRRQFASSAPLNESHLLRQLNKAKDMFESIAEVEDKTGYDLPYM